MTAEIIKYDAGNETETVSAFLERPAFDRKTEETAREILADIRANGNEAVIKYASRFDNAALSPDDFLVKDTEVAEAGEQVDPAFRDAVAETLKRVAAFAETGMKQDWDIPTPGGGKLGEQFTPLDRVGIYVPGGTAPLASTALMTATLARAAGVPEIVACTPCNSALKINPFLLYALNQAGTTEIYRLGGIQAVGLMAYGTKTVNKVQKIVGPGNAYVTAAKKLVYGCVALDLVAGPSEIAILADKSAEADLVAADLLSQAEHGTGLEKSLLVTTSITLAQAVQQELEDQVATLSRQDAAREVLDKGTLLVVVGSLEEGMKLCNRFAPEHLELMVEKPETWLKKVRNAGAVFVGKWSPESTGDFVAGPSHVLPTGGAAAMFSGLTVDDFRKRSSIIEFTEKDLKDALPVIEAFGRVEGLDAHAKSAQKRFEKKN